MYVGEVTQVGDDFKIDSLRGTVDSAVCGYLVVVLLKCALLASLVGEGYSPEPGSRSMGRNANGQFFCMKVRIGMAGDTRRRQGRSVGNGGPEQEAVLRKHGVAIYVSDHCGNCSYAWEIAALIRAE